MARTKRSNALRPTKAKSFREQYNFVRFLGTGGEGVAELYKNKFTGILVVSKTNGCSEDSYDESSEIEQLRQLSGYNCPQVIELLDHELHSPNPGEARLVLEYCERGDLQDYRSKIMKSGYDVPESFMWHVFTQLVEGLAFLHAAYGTRHYNTSGWEPVIHRDIEPPNILLTNRYGTTALFPHGYPDIKLADFGCAGPEVKGRDRRGTADWQPPERPEWTTAGDVWAMGAIVHWLALGYAPVARLTPEENVQDPAKRGWFRARKERMVTEINSAAVGYEYGYSDCINEWMLDCLDFDPEGRPTAVELLDSLIPDAIQIGTQSDLKRIRTRTITAWGRNGNDRVAELSEDDDSGADEDEGTDDDDVDEEERAENENEEGEPAEDEDNEDEENWSLYEVRDEDKMDETW